MWGIEYSEESIACAVENAELNGIANAAFFAGDVARDLDELRDRAGPPDVVVVDPPRAGLAGKAVRRVGELQAPRLVYVSCNPTTLAGNAKELVRDFGYTPRPRAPGGHVPPHAAHRDGRPLHAGGRLPGNVVTGSVRACARRSNCSVASSALGTARTFSAASSSAPGKPVARIAAAAASRS